MLVKPCTNISLGELRINAYKVLYKRFFGRYELDRIRVGY